MANLVLCRICLATDIKMHAIINTPYQTMYEKFTDVQLVMNDGRPIVLCYLCHSQLRTFSRFYKMSIKAEKYLTQLLQKRLLPYAVLPHIESVHNLSLSPLQTMSLPHQVPNSIIKVEATDLMEMEPSGNYELFYDDAEGEEGALVIDTRDEDTGNVVDTNGFDVDISLTAMDDVDTKDIDIGEVTITENIADNINTANANNTVNSRFIVIDTGHIVNTGNMLYNTDILDNEILLDTRNKVDTENSIDIKAATDIKNKIEIENSIDTEAVIVIKNQIDIEHSIDPRNLIDTKNAIDPINIKDTENSIDPRNITDTENLIDPRNITDTENSIDSENITVDEKPMDTIYSDDVVKVPGAAKTMDTIYSDDIVNVPQVNINTVKQTYACTQCNKKFRFDHQLKFHLKIHAQSTTCYICQRKFTQSNTLELHFARAHNRKPLKTYGRKKVVKKPG